MFTPAWEIAPWFNQPMFVLTSIALTNYTKGAVSSDTLQVEGALFTIELEKFQVLIRNPR